MKVEIEKFTAKRTQKIEIVISKSGRKKLCDPECYVTKGHTYYEFMTEEKAWIRHSGKLTKEEKQWVIEQEVK